MSWTLLARGPWKPERVTVRFVPHTIVREAAAGEILARAWEAARERATASGQTLFPGPVLGLAAFRASGCALALDLHATDYREFVGTNLCAEYLRLPRETAPRADALGISVVLVSGETVVLHRRGAGCFEWPLAVDTPGGHMEPARHPTPFACGLDELESELGIAAGEVTGLRALALTRIADTEKPQLVLAARTSVEPDAIRARVERARESFETNELVPVARRDLAKLAASSERLTPAVRAALALAQQLL